jgi:hypothetical protein
VQCAIAAPSGTEYWRFIQIGPETVQKLVQLPDKLGSSAQIDKMESDVPADADMDIALTADVADNAVEWTSIPGWVVVTTVITLEDAQVEQEDFKSTCCAVQNFLFEHVEGVRVLGRSGRVVPCSALPSLPNCVEWIRTRSGWRGVFGTDSPRVDWSMPTPSAGKRAWTMC